jgi:urate oxidase
MRGFASGRKRSYYGKGDVLVYRLHRQDNAPAGQSPVFGANVMMLLFGDAFWPTYVTGDNTNLIATDSMKNFIQRETMNFPDGDLESYCKFLAEKFLNKYPYVEGAQISASEVPYAGIGNLGVTFIPSGPEKAFAQIEITRSSAGLSVAEIRSGIQGFRLLRLNGSAFHGFVRDEYTTLPDIANRPLHMWLDLDWTYTETAAAWSKGSVTQSVRTIVREVFDAFTSGSIQQIIHEMGTRILKDLPAINEVNLEANNRTWDTLFEQGDAVGIYTDARPPFGCLGLTLRRS